MFSFKTIGFALIIIAVFGLAYWQLFAYRAAEPKYKILQQDNAITIREYTPIIIASVMQDGSREQAINQGFRILADYIFGDNKPHSSIAMTAPVMQKGTTIEMTAPISQIGQNNQWEIRFVMPDNYTLDNLPKPNDSRIHLTAIPAKKMAVIKFNGGSSAANLAQHENLLRDYLIKNHIDYDPTPIFAFYNPPWILPFLRRNEIMFALR